MNHRPLRVQFVVTSLPVGGAETLLLNLVRQMDKLNFRPEVTCLKEAGELGPAIAEFAPVHSNFLRSKWDLRVLGKLKRHFTQCQPDAVITVGAGDKMFWGRLAAKWAKVPVICSALHSTGWPDGVGKLNRLLTTITDGFIAVANNHAQFMVDFERFPAEKVFMIPNGVDTSRFVPDPACRSWLRAELGVSPESNVVGIVAALRPEKNHLQFVAAAERVLQQLPNTHFVIVGDGPERGNIEAAILNAGLQSHFHLLGSRHDTEKILAGLDLFCLTSRNEANPVSILEALACGIPVVAPNVGSIAETVVPHQTGILTEPLCAAGTANSIYQLLSNRDMAAQFGRAGRSLVVNLWSLDAMVEGYQSLIERLYNRHNEQHDLLKWSRVVSNDPNLISDTIVLMPGLSTAINTPVEVNCH